MGFLEAILLGLVQGLTEFLPISSSAHLVIVPAALGLAQPDLFFAILLHVASVLAVVTYFFKDIIHIIGNFFRGLMRSDLGPDGAKPGLMLILSAVPAAFVGVFASDTIESAFQNPKLVGMFLLVTSLILFSSEMFTFKYKKMEEISYKDTLIAGIAQALAVFPGISRSGSTMAFLLFRGLKRDEAARFSFLMSVIIIAGAGANEALNAPMATFTNDLAALSAGFFFSFLSSFLAIKYLMRFLKFGTFYPFAAYCAVVGTLSIIYL